MELIELSEIEACVIKCIFLLLTLTFSFNVKHFFFTTSQSGVYAYICVTEIKASVAHTVDIGMHCACTFPRFVHL